MKSFRRKTRFVTFGCQRVPTLANHRRLTSYVDGLDRIFDSERVRCLGENFHRLNPICIAQLCSKRLGLGRSDRFKDRRTGYFWSNDYKSFQLDRHRVSTRANSNNLKSMGEKLLNIVNEVLESNSAS